MRHVAFVALVGCALAVGCGDDDVGASGWERQDIPEQTAAASYALWVFGDSDVWIGSSSAWHFDGATWTDEPPVAGAFIVDFWGFAPNDLWAISNDAMFHWTGTAWTAIAAPTGFELESLWRIWGTSGTNIYVANTDNSRVYHFDGAAWTVETLQFVQATALWGSGPNDIWLSGITDLYHYDGTWTQDDDFESPSSATGIWGFGPNDVWAAGGFEELSHWDGTAWSGDDEAVEGSSYNDVWGSASDDVWAVGNQRSIAHWTGSRWSSSTDIGATENFTSIHGSSPDNIWATSVEFRDFKGYVYRKR